MFTASDLESLVNFASMSHSIGHVVPLSRHTSNLSSYFSSLTYLGLSNLLLVKCFPMPNSSKIISNGAPMKTWIPGGKKLLKQIKHFNLLHMFKKKTWQI